MCVAVRDNVRNWPIASFRGVAEFGRYRRIADSGKHQGTWAAFTPDGLFVTSGNPKEMFTLKRGLETLPMDEFVAANRRESLAEVLTAAR